VKRMLSQEFVFGHSWGPKGQNSRPNAFWTHQEPRKRG